MTLNAGKRERGKEDVERRKQKKKQRVRLMATVAGRADGY